MPRGTCLKTLGFKHKYCRTIEVFHPAVTYSSKSVADFASTYGCDIHRFKKN